MLDTQTVDNYRTARLGNTVVIADDHELVLEGIARILREHYSVVASAKDGRSLVELVMQYLPDFVVADLSMPSMNGVEAIRRIRAISPRTKIIAATQHNDRHYMRAAFAAGASAYVLKQSAAAELLEALQTLSNGQSFISPGLLDSIELSRFESNANPGDLFGGNLTPRQREVVQLVAEGLPAKQIAFELNISTKTVEFHKAAAMQQLGFQSSAELIRFAVETGIVHS